MTSELEYIRKGTHKDNALQIIYAAVSAYPDSISLAKAQARLIAECGSKIEALDACESFLVNFGMDNDLLEMAAGLRAGTGHYDRIENCATAETISLCMIVKNEEQHLARCLASLKPVVDEMVIVDTGSSDRTIDLAKLFGAKVSVFSWNGSFSDARNYAIQQAKGAWILVMDADEVLSKQDYAIIKETVSFSASQRIAWSVLTRNYTTRVNAQGWIANDHAYLAEERADGWHPSWKVRLFRNHPDIRFIGEVHEMVENSLQVAGYSINKASFVVHHYGGLAESAEEAAEKGRRYFEIGMKKLEQNPNNVGALAELAVQAGEIGSFEEAIQLWDRLLAIIPDNVEALFNKGYSLIKLRRYQESLDISEKVLVLEPDHKESAFNYGTSALYIGEPPKSVQKLEPILLKNPEYPPLLSIMTLLYLISGQRGKAVGTYSKLKAMNYSVTDYAKDRADILRGLGREDLACTLLEECAAIGMLQI